MTIRIENIRALVHVQGSAWLKQNVSAKLGLLARLAEKGYMIAVVCLLGFKAVTLTSLVVPMLILGIPILDTLFAILRRRLKGESIANPDKSHIYHQLLNMQFSYSTTVLIIYAIQILFAIASIVYVLKDRTLGYVIYTILVIIVLWLVLKTDVVFDHEDLKNRIKNLTKK